MLSNLLIWDDRPTARSGAENMAIDEALLCHGAQTESPILRLYRWDRPTLSFGYFQKSAEALAALLPGESMIRRWTGGGLVHHAEDLSLTWTLTVPPGHPFSQTRPTASYALLHQALARALHVPGEPAPTLVPATSPAPAQGLCAQLPSPGDLLSQNRKIAGAGQRRTRHGLLHQGVIFLPESILPPEFPRRLADSLAAKVLAFLPPSHWDLPLDRYLHPNWNVIR